MTLPYRTCSHRGCRAHAAFGLGVALTAKPPREGTWYCRDHLPPPPVGPELGGSA